MGQILVDLVKVVIFIMFLVGKIEITFLEIEQIVVVVVRIEV